MKEKNTSKKSKLKMAIIIGIILMIVPIIINLVLMNVMLSIDNVTTLKIIGIISAVMRLIPVFVMITGLITLIFFAINKSKVARIILTIICLLVLLAILGWLGYGYYKKITIKPENPIATIEVEKYGTIKVELCFFNHRRRTDNI